MFLVEWDEDGRVARRVQSLYDADVGGLGGEGKRRLVLLG